MFLLSFKNDVMLIRDFLSDGSNLLLQIVEKLIFVGFLFDQECCNNKYELIFVRNREWTQIPIVDDECQMVANLYELTDFFAVGECFTHDSDEHVQEMDNHEELGEHIEESQEHFLTALSNAIRGSARTTQAKLPHVPER